MFVLQNTIVREKEEISQGSTSQERDKKKERGLLSSKGGELLGQKGEIRRIVEVEIAGMHSGEGASEVFFIVRTTFRSAPSRSRSWRILRVNSIHFKFIGK